MSFVDEELVEVPQDEETKEGIGASTVEIQEQTEESNTQTPQPVKKDSTSNFKAMRQALREQRDEVRLLKEQLASIQSQSQQTGYEDEDGNEEEFQEYEEEEAPQKNNDIKSLEFDVFTLKNPDALDYQREIQRVQKQHPSLSLVDAYKLAKANAPQSRSTTEYDVSSAPPKPVKKALKDITPEEALKLSPENQAKWRKEVLMKTRSF